jgi:nitrite reductase/ring-hydroxylating ferredoxin subunit
LLYNDGEIKAFENICTHKGGPSKLKQDKLVCQWHGAIFEPLTGEALKGPAPKGSKLPAIELEEREGSIYVKPVKAG